MARQKTGLDLLDFLTYFHAYMTATAEVLRQEAKRLRSLADRMDAFAIELNGVAAPNTKRHTSALRVTMEANGGLLGEYAGMTQKAAIVKALQHGPQTTREIFTRLTAGGLPIKSPLYITALLGRLKDKVERGSDKKLRLKG